MSAARRRQARRHIAFVTGTRAELGLMLRTLRAIGAHPELKLSVIATGMHLDGRAGPKLSALRAARITPTAVVEWARHDSPAGVAGETGLATARMAKVFARLGVDGVLVVGDRVEAFAAAAAAHLSRIPLAHVHGGDRAEGQVDDSLRHAITKLAHLHLAATKSSADRIVRLGEDPRRVHVVGAPGVERIAAEAAARAEIARRFPDAANSVLVLLHPTDPDEAAEAGRARALLRAMDRAGLTRRIVIGPNNDPGAAGIWKAWEGQPVVSDLPRATFLGLVRDCRALVGNSSAGIIEAASLGARVLDIGSRQAGRERGGNVVSAGWSPEDLAGGLRKTALPARRWPGANPYQRPGTAARIARLLASGDLVRPVPPKLILY